LRRADGDFVSIPGPDVVLAPGTTLIALGTSEQLAALGRRVGVELRPS
jgi:K+/H+ antiporter YhaU regulatory subunit KhtT